MKFGIFSMSTDYSMPFDQLAVAVEARGFESIWVPEHTHIPACRTTPSPFGGELPKPFSHTLDPFIALAAASAVTEKIRLGTSVCLPVEHPTIPLAKTIATLDHMSKGRVELGIGAGWNREEMENLGTNYETRFKKLEEQMQALSEIWNNDEATFHGNFDNFDRIWSWPKPIQKSRPPLLIGGRTKYSLQRIVKYGDGWIPDFQEAREYRDGIKLMHELARNEGRDPDSLSVTAYAAPASIIQELRDLPIERVVLLLPGGNEHDTLLQLDKLASEYLQ